MTYRSELVQVAATCLAAAQVEEVSTTCLLRGNAEGLRGRWSLEHLLAEVRKERESQEVKWGTWHGEDAPPAFWLLVMLEEVGEVAEEIRAAGGPLPAYVADAVALGAKARALLELQ